MIKLTGRVAKSDLVPPSSELIRISRIPRRTLSAADKEWLAEELTARLRKPRGTMRLKPVQAWALYELGMVGGLFGPITVGGGKTLFLFLAPTVMKAQRPLLIVPGALVEKTKRDKEILEQHWHIQLFIRIVSFEWLGREEQGDNPKENRKNALEEWNPDLVLIDECHRAKNTKDAAVARRLTRFFRKRPNVMCVAVSGTITARSILEYAHILAWCLPGEYFPLPTHWNELQLWADAVDERQNSIRTVDPGALEILCQDPETKKLWAMDRVKAGRLTYRERLVETPGVVATNEAEINATLIIRGRKVTPGPAVDQAFKLLRDSGVTPDGEDIVDAIAVARHARELALGFYYCWWNEEGFFKCLTDQRKRKAQQLSSTEQKILNDSVHTIGNGIVLARAVGILRNEKKLPEFGSSRSFTGSQTTSSRSFFPNTTASVTSAASAGTFREAERGKDISGSITITKPEKSGDCFAGLATGPLQYWTTVLREFPGLFSIFSQAVDAAKPPNEWLRPRKAWFQWVRQVLKHSRTYDSELAVRRYAEGLLTKWLPAEWLACLKEILLPPRDQSKRQFDTAARQYWSAALTAVVQASYRGDPKLIEGPLAGVAWKGVEETFEINTVPVWIDSAACEFAAAWAKKNVGIVWVEHKCVGERLRDEFGLPYYAEQGLDQRGSFIDDHDPKKSLVASRPANSEGRNLQKWSKNLITSLLPNGARNEQLLGRTHRPMQQADEVEFDFMVSCRENLDALYRAMGEARYIESSTGSPQKLLLATVDVDEASLRDSGPRWESKEE